MIKLANATMHDQSQYLDAFRNFGFEVNQLPDSGKYQELGKPAISLVRL